MPDADSPIGLGMIDEPMWSPVNIDELMSSPEIGLTEKLAA